MIYIDADDLRRDNVALLVKKREISICRSPVYTYTDESWDILAEVIRTTTTLVKLDFPGETAIALQNDKVAHALANNRTIKNLVWCFSSSIGNKEAIAVAAILKQNSTIEEVCLSYNDIGEEGAKAIADALKENPSLRELYIGGNKIGDEGAKAIAEALKENASLRELDIELNSIGEEGGKYILNALQQIERSAIESIYLGDNKISKETRAKIDKEMIRIKEGFKGVGSNGGQVAANGSQGVQNKRTSNGDKEMPTTIHTTNASQGSAENVQETNETVHNTAAMETEVEHLKSTIAQLQSKIAEQDKELASTKDIFNKIGDMVNGRHGGTTTNPSNDSMPDRETERLQSENERYKQEIDSLKEQLKNSKPIETVDLTNEIEPASSGGGEDSNEEEPPSKRRRTKSNLAVALEQTQQMVKVKEEAKERAAVAEANVASARREKDAVEASLRDVQEDLEDSTELVTQQALTTDIWQGRFDELFELARAAGVDGNTLSEIRYRPLSSGR